MDDGSHRPAGATDEAAPGSDAADGPGAAASGPEAATSAPGSAADALIASLREGGREVDAGEFGLDREVAQQKLRQYQLPDRRFYLLKLAQAAICQGATKVSFELGRRVVRVRFDGRPFTARDFDGLYSELFTSAGRTERSGIRHLAIGINAALSFEPDLVTVVSGDGERGVELRSTAGSEDVITEVRAPVSGTVVQVQSPRGRAPTQLEEQVDATELHERDDLEALLRQRCAYADVEIEVHRRRVSQGMHLEQGVSVRELAVPGARGVAGLTPALERRSEVRFLFDGIWIVTERLGGLPDGFLAVVESSRLEMDISESGILRNAAFDEVHREVERARKAVIRDLAARLEADPKPEGLDANWARGVLRQALWPAADRRYYRGGRHDPLARGLSSVPLWNGIFHGGNASRLCSLDEVLAVLEGGDRVAYLHVPTVRSSQVVAVATPAGTGVSLVLEADGDVRFLQRLVGEPLVHLCDLEQRVAGAEQRRREREAAEQGGGQIVWIAVGVLAVLGVIVLLLATLG